MSWIRSFFNKFVVEKNHDNDRELEKLVKPTNFDKVGEFHYVFDHPKHNTPQLDIFENKPELVKLRIALIQEELEEFKQACDEKNMVEIADALCDILYVTYGAGHVFGFNLDTMFDEVHQSNMTKTCSNLQDAEDSVKAYQNDPRYKEPDYKKCGDYYVIYDKATGKILKNHKFRLPDLSKFIN